MDYLDKVLTEFGLNDNERILYLAAIKERETTPYKLAKTTNIPRGTVYDTLTSLSLKGLIEMIHPGTYEKQQTRIRAKNPSIIREIIRKRQKELTLLETEVVEILPFLKSEFKSTTDDSNFQFYPGISGAKEVYKLDNLPANVPHYQITNETPMDAVGSTFTNNEVDKEMDALSAQKVRNKELIQLNEWTQHVVSYQYGRNKKYLEEQEVRYIDDPIFDIKLNIGIRENRVSIMNLDGNEAYGLVVHSESLARSLTSIFLLIWRGATPITTEMVENWGYNRFLAAQANARGIKG